MKKVRYAFRAAVAAAVLLAGSLSGAAVTMALTSPFHLVTVPKTDAAVTFCYTGGGQSASEDAPANPSDALEALFPSSAGFTWLYQGFAEYGQRMTLSAVETVPEGTRYSVNGRISDPSGGAAGGNFTFNLSYLVTDKAVIRNVAAESRLMDDAFAELELVRLPLEKGTEWTQRTADRSGTIYTLSCRITGVSGQEGEKRYEIEYRDAERDYLAKRTLREGSGIVFVEIPWKDFRIGYSLIRSGTDLEKVEAGR